MRYKVRQAGKNQKLIEFHISKDMVSARLEEIYREIAKTASLPGFRSGKAPLDVVRRRFKKEADGEAVKTLLADSFKKAAGETGLNIIGYPEISEINFDAEKGMSYKATVNMMPDVRIKAYKGLRLKKTVKEVKDADVESEINTLRGMSAKFATKEGAAEDGDYVVADTDCEVEGYPSERKENAWLFVGEGGFIPADSLKGLKVGGETELEKVLPKDYSKKEVAGKKAKFHVKAREIKKKVLPELNDEFAATLGKFRNMSELREAVRENIKMRNRSEEKKDLINQALALLDKNAPFEAPQFMVDKHLAALIERAEAGLRRQGLAEEDIKSRRDYLKEGLKAEAAKEVRAFFIMEEIARLENIKAEKKDSDAALKAIALSSGRKEEEVRKYYEEHNLTENLKEDIKQRKVLDFVITNANFTP